MCSLCVLLSCQIKEYERNSHSFLPSCHFSLTKLWVLHLYFEIALPLDHLVTQVLSSMNSSLKEFTLLFLPLESFSLGSREAILLISFQTLVGLFFLPVDVPLGSIYPSPVPVFPSSASCSSPPPPSSLYILFTAKMSTQILLSHF